MMVSHTKHKESQNQFHEEQEQGPLSQGSTIPMPTCKKAVDHKFIISGGHSVEFNGWTAKKADIGTAIRQIPYTLPHFDVGR